MRQDIYDGQLKDCKLMGATKWDYEERSGAGAASLTARVSYWTSTGASQVVTLADGAQGQVKTFIHAVDGGSLVITPANFGGLASTTITLIEAGDSCSFIFLNGNWWLTAVVANTEGTPLVIA
jgi:hypothetical protein